MRNVTLFLLTLVLGSAVTIGGWWTLFLRDHFGATELELQEKTEEIAQLAVEVQAKDERIQLLDLEVSELEEDVVNLETSLRLVKVDHRVAELETLEQYPDPENPDKVITRVRFTEFDVDGVSLGEPMVIEVKGKYVYIETLVVKFDDALIEAGDPLRGSSICLFKRMFGEDQEPSEGTPIDTSGAQPLVYGGDTTPDPLIQDIWGRFWELANDPEAAEALGVRGIHGDAPFIEVRPGKRYKLELRSSDGLTIKPMR
ncbi:MAG: hypothetical protein ACI8QS_000048 [Planctomycetota bacterium]|jgi:hypothetical protein